MFEEELPQQLCFLKCCKYFLLLDNEVIGRTIGREVGSIISVEFESKETFYGSLLSVQHFS